MMRRAQPAGFEEIPHIADWSLRVWAPDHATLFATAAKGMNALAGMTLATSPRVERKFETESADEESLLVAFLSELVYYTEQEYLGFDEFFIERLESDVLKVVMRGATIESLNKAIKAVTYHNLKIERVDARFEVEIVFDV